MQKFTVSFNLFYFYVL